MKTVARKLVLKTLKLMAKRRLKKFRGKIIAVTGSVGKTSTKEAIYTVLNTQFKVKRNKRSMNSEFGLLLTILDIESGYSSATKWSWYLLKGFFHSLFRDHSEILLLELGVDKPGDMDFLISVLRPDLAIITNISHVHLDEGQFANIDEVFAEKSKIALALKDHGKAILNLDDGHLAGLMKKIGKKHCVTFGRDKDADFWASQIKLTLEGTNFLLHHDNKRYDVKFKPLGDFQVYVAMPAIICGLLFNMNMDHILAALDRFKLPPGRMTVLDAINEATILDSSYNCSPVALKEALLVLKELGEKRRKIAVIGNMNELGNYSKELHEKAGEQVAKCADVLLTVGSEAAHIAASAQSNGMEVKNIFKFKSAMDAAAFFRDQIKKGDLILVKGSQNNVRLERFVKEIMVNPQDAKKLLVRQEKAWEGKS